MLDDVTKAYQILQAELANLEKAKASLILGANEEISKQQKIKKLQEKIKSIKNIYN